MDDLYSKPEKAYRNRRFIDSRDGRPLRILSEYLEPEARFDREGVIDTIVFFGSARLGSREEAAAALDRAIASGSDIERAQQRLELSRYYEEARELARRLTEWSLALPDPGRFVVCTGGGPGIMEAANRGAAEAGGKSIGLTISIPDVEEFENTYVTPSLAFEFHYFFMRKFWFTYLAKAVVIMPGGFGTMDELFELLTLLQTLKMKKRLPVVLFGSKFWDEVVNFDALVRHGTINANDLSLFHRTESVEDAFVHLTTRLSRERPPRGAVL